jgi:hypothetical protein
MADIPTGSHDPPLKQLAIAYGVRKKGRDQLSGVSAAIQGELPATAWDDMSEISPDDGSLPNSPRTMRSVK